MPELTPVVAFNNESTATQSPSTPVTVPVRTVLTNSLERTSVKGIPRMVKSQTFSLKLLWSISVFVLLSAATYHCYELLMEQYTDSTVTSTNNQIATLADDQTHFPDVTLCNLNPFMGNASQVMAQLGIPTVEDYASITNATVNDRVHLLEELLTSHGYFAYVREQKAAAMSHTLDSFVPRRNALLDLYGFRGKSEAWALHGVIDNFTDYIHYRCFTFRAWRPHPDDLVVVGLSATIHLDNFFEDPYEHFDIEHDKGQYKGALMVLHEPHSFPEVINSGVYLPPGTLSDLKIQLQGHNRMENPSEPCKNTDELVNNIWNYSRNPCLSACLERAVMNDCNCMDLRLLQVLDEDPDMPYCHGIENGSLEDMLRDIECADDVRNRQLQYCQENCPNQCYELDYHVSVSYANWPPKPLSYKFYDDEIAGQPFESRYSIVKDVLYNASASAALNSAATDLIHDNFLHFNLYVAEFRYLEYEEIPRISSFNLVAQLGGALNLWAGITVVVFVEAVDFLFNVLLEWNKQKNVDDVGSLPNENGHQQQQQQP